MSSKRPEQFTMKVLVICPSKVMSTGNFCTVKRIQNHLMSAGINCQIADACSFTSESILCTRRRLSHLVVTENFTGVLFLHAYKGAKILLCTEDHNCSCEGDTFPVPYGIIFGGTDLNLDISDVEKLVSMQKVMRFANFAVAFTEALKEAALNLAPKLKIFVQPQAVEIAERFASMRLCENNNVIASYKQDGSKHGCVFIMVTGIRPVKHPLFIMDAWMQLITMHKECKLKLLIIGPILDETYAEVFFQHLNALREQYLEKLGRPEIFDRSPLLHEIYTWADSDAFPILYSPPLLPDELKSFMLSGCVFASVNSSESEGMSSAILESMALKVPVIARDNSGNKAIISDETTGLLFHTPADFAHQATRLISEFKLRENIVENAFKMVLKSHCIEKEKALYKDLCEAYFL